MKAVSADFCQEITRNSKKSVGVLTHHLGKYLPITLYLCGNQLSAMTTPAYINPGNITHLTFMDHSHYSISNTSMSTHILYEFGIFFPLT